jgi:hypothetical protein
VPEFVPLVAKPDQGQLRLVEPGVEARAECARQIAVDVDAAVEKGFEQPNVAEGDGTPFRHFGAKRQRDSGRPVAGLNDDAVR